MGAAELFIGVHIKSEAIDSEDSAQHCRFVKPVIVPEVRDF